MKPSNFLDGYKSVQLQDGPNRPSCVRRLALISDLRHPSPHLLQRGGRGLAEEPGMKAQVDLGWSWDQNQVLTPELRAAYRHPCTQHAILCTSVPGTA